MITAQITDIKKLDESTLTVQVTFSNGSLLPLNFPVDVKETEIMDAIRVELERLNSVEEKINILRAQLIDKVIEA